MTAHGRFVYSSNAVTVVRALQKSSHIFSTGLGNRKILFKPIYQNDLMDRKFQRSDFFGRFGLLLDMGARRYPNRIYLRRLTTICKLFESFQWARPDGGVPPGQKVSKQELCLWKIRGLKPYVSNAVLAWFLRTRGF